MRNDKKRNMFLISKLATELIRTPLATNVEVHKNVPKLFFKHVPTGYTIAVQIKLWHYEIIYEPHRTHHKTLLYRESEGLYYQKSMSVKKVLDIVNNKLYGTP